MATAMMGLRRRVPPANGSNNSPLSSPAASSSSSNSGKRSRSENNNCPSHDNLNCSTAQQEPPSKKSRGSGAKNAGECKTTRGKSAAAQKRAAALATNVDYAASDTTWPGSEYNGGLATVAAAGAAQASLCTGSMGIPYMATSMATYVGSAAGNCKSSASVSYLDISNMTAGGGSAGGQQQQVGYLKQQTSSSGVAVGLESSNNLPYNGGTGAVFLTKQGNNNNSESNNASAVVVQPPPTLPSKFPNDSMFNAYQPWVIKTYGDLAKTKTITIKKYARILRTLRGEEVNSAENSKFRFWVKSKGFHIGQPEGYDAKPADRIIGRHAVTNPGLDPPLYVPTQPPHNKVSF